jgi:hypothetical protein
MRYILLLVPAIALTAAFWYVQHEITSGLPSVSLPQSPVTLTPIDPEKIFGSGFKFDEQEMQRLNGQNIANQNRLFNQKMEDMRNYARNPAGWRGAPPF